VFELWQREQAQASAPDEHLTFLCDECREELKRSPQPVPGYDMVKVWGEAAWMRNAGARSEIRTAGRD